MVGALMTTAVVNVRPDTGFKDIVQHLAEHDITAVPVVDDQGRPIGVVSEADLLRKQDSRADPDGHQAARHLSCGTYAKIACGACPENPVPRSATA
ncbi:hypothetical protein ADL12_07095 [Streptomyces regalis]|uniref:CBS domain-containing protein n=2 Tax=Streptomyces regalis TaxID=68262 RepID=A0A0X3VFT9_9ACTN|nr:hypothetical protein ADL12_07095 [Streptomyces regalis]